MMSYTHAYLRRRAMRPRWSRQSLDLSKMITARTAEAVYQEYGYAERSSDHNMPPPWTLVEYECDHHRCRSIGGGTKCRGLLDE